MDRRTEVERELSLLVTKMDRLMDALAEGTAPKDEIIARLNEEKQRKTLLVAELMKLSELAGIESLDDAKLKRELHERVADVKPLLAENTTQAQMLRTLLAGFKIEIKGFGEDCERGYKFRREQAIGNLISGAATDVRLAWPQREATVRGASKLRSSCHSWRSGPNGIWHTGVFPTMPFQGLATAA